MARRELISVRKPTPVRKVKKANVENQIAFIQEQYDKNVCGIHLQTFYNIFNMEQAQDVMLSQSLGRWIMARRLTFDSLHIAKRIKNLLFLEMFIYNPYEDSYKRVNSSGRAVRNVIIDIDKSECFTITRSIVRIIGIRNKDLNTCDVFMVGEKSDFETEKEVWEVYDENFFC